MGALMVRRAFDWQPECATGEKRPVTLMRQRRREIFSAIVYAASYGLFHPCQRDTPNKVTLEQQEYDEYRQCCDHGSGHDQIPGSAVLDHEQRQSKRERAHLRTADG